MDIERRTFPAIYMAFRTYAGPVSRIAEAIPALVDAVRLAGGEPLGPPVALFPSAEQDPEAILARLCVPVAPGFAGHAGLRTLTLGPVDVAVARHLGPYQDIGRAYEALSTWVDEHGMSLAEGVSETFVIGPHSGVVDSKWQTDVAVRLKAP